VKGLFITFEGPDGAGKTTHIRFVRQMLEEAGRRVVTTREPGGTEVSEAIRAIVLNPSYSAMDEKTELLLYLAARAQHVSEVILPALRTGMDVLCDRFSDSTFAYQGFGRGIDMSRVEEINAWVCLGLEPDFTFFHLLTPEESGKRLIKKPADRLEAESVSFKEKVYQGFLRQAQRRPNQTLILDATQEIRVNQCEIKRAVQDILKLYSQTTA